MRNRHQLGKCRRLTSHQPLDRSPLRQTSSLALRDQIPLQRKLTLLCVVNKPQIVRLVLDKREQMCYDTRDSRTIGSCVRYHLTEYYTICVQFVKITPNRNLGRLDLQMLLAFRHPQGEELGRGNVDKDGEAPERSQ